MIHKATKPASLMNTKSFLQGSFSLTTALIASQYEPTEVADSREIVQICIIGSLKGISTIIHSLHQRGFSEVNDWCKPQPTGKPNQYVNILLRSISPDRQ